MTTTECPRCHTENTTPPAVIGPICARRVETDLRTTPQLLDLLDDTTARLDRIDRPSGLVDDDPDRGLPLTTSVQPLPFAPGASDAGDQLRAVLTGWARVLWDGHPWTTPPPADGYGAALWLADRLTHLVEHPAADEAAHEIDHACNAAWALIDRPPDNWWVGTCTTNLGTGPLAARCQWQLHARIGAKTVTCPGCGARHDVTARRERMLEAAAHTLVTAVQASRALTSLDRPVTPAAIRAWRHRGHFAPLGVNDAGQPLYRFGDITRTEHRIRYGQTQPEHEHESEAS